jgi:hypothetical protein
MWNLTCAGISSAYGGVLSALEIIYTLTPEHDGLPDGHRQDPFMAGSSASDQRYIEREEVYALYPNQRVEIAVEQRTL